MFAMISYLQWVEKVKEKERENEAEGSTAQSREKVMSRVQREKRGTPLL